MLTKQTIGLTRITAIPTSHLVLSNHGVMVVTRCMSANMRDSKMFELLLLVVTDATVLVGS